MEHPYGRFTFESAATRAKKRSVARSSAQKRAKFSAQLPQRQATFNLQAVEDADTIRIDGQPNRFATQDGYSVDAFETPEGKTRGTPEGDAWWGSTNNRNKMVSQRKAIARLKTAQGTFTDWKNVSEDEVFQRGIEGRNTLRDRIAASQDVSGQHPGVPEEYNATVTDRGIGYYGRPLAGLQAPDGTDLVDSVNTQRDNAAYDSYWNREKRRGLRVEEGRRYQERQADLRARGAYSDEDIKDPVAGALNKTRSFFKTVESQRVNLGTLAARTRQDNTFGNATREEQRAFRTRRAKEQLQDKFNKGLDRAVKPGEIDRFTKELAKVQLTGEEQALSTTRPRNTVDEAKIRRTMEAKGKTEAQIKEKISIAKGYAKQYSKDLIGFNPYKELKGAEDDENTVFKTARKSVKDMQDLVNTINTQKASAILRERGGQELDAIGSDFNEMLDGKTISDKAGAAVSLVKNLAITGKNIALTAIDQPAAVADVAADSLPYMLAALAGGGISAASTIALGNQAYDTGLVDFKRIQGRDPTKEERNNMKVLSFAYAFSERIGDVALLKGVKNSIPKALKRKPKSEGQIRADAEIKAGKAEVKARDTATKREGQSAVRNLAETSVVGGAKAAKNVLTSGPVKRTLGGVLTEGAQEAFQTSIEEYLGQNDLSKIDWTKVYAGTALGAGVGSGIAGGLSIPEALGATLAGGSDAVKKTIKGTKEGVQKKRRNFKKNTAKIEDFYDETNRDVYDVSMGLTRDKRQFDTTKDPAKRKESYNRILQEVDKRGTQIGKEMREKGIVPGSVEAVPYLAELDNLADIRSAVFEEGPDIKSESAPDAPTDTAVDNQTTQQKQEATPFAEAVDNKANIPEVTPEMAAEIAATFSDADFSLVNSLFGSINEDPNSENSLFSEKFVGLSPEAMKGKLSESDQAILKAFVEAKEQIEKIPLKEGKTSAEVGAEVLTNSKKNDVGKLSAKGHIQGIMEALLQPDAPLTLAEGKLGNFAIFVARQKAKIAAIEKGINTPGVEKIWLPGNRPFTIQRKENGDGKEGNSQGLVENTLKPELAALEALYDMGQGLIDEGYKKAGLDPKDSISNITKAELTDVLEGLDAAGIEGVKQDWKDGIKLLRSQLANAPDKEAREKISNVMRELNAAIKEADKLLAKTSKATKTPTKTGEKTKTKIVLNVGDTVIPRKGPLTGEKVTVVSLTPRVKDPTGKITVRTADGKTKTIVATDVNRLKAPAEPDSAPTVDAVDAAIADAFSALSAGEANLEGGAGSDTVSGADNTVEAMQDEDNNDIPSDLGVEITPNTEPKVGFVQQIFDILKEIQDLPAEVKNSDAFSEMYTQLVELHIAINKGEGQNQIKPMERRLNTLMAPYRMTTESEINSTYAVITAKKYPLQSILTNTLEIFFGAQYTDPKIRSKRSQLIATINARIKDSKNLEQAENAVHNLTINFYEKNGYPSTQTLHTINAMEDVNPILDIENDYKFGGATSVFSLIPNFFSALKSDPVVDYLKGKLGLNRYEIGQLRGNLTKFRNEFKSNYYAAISRPTSVIDRHLRRTPLNGFLDEYNELPENVLDAMAISAFVYIATRGRETLVNTEDDIKAMLDLQNEEYLPPGALGLLSNLGDLMKNPSRLLSNEIANMLSIKGNATSDGYIIDKTHKNLGDMTLQTLNQMGLMKITNVKSSILSDLRSDEQRGESGTGITKGYTPFIRMVGVLYEGYTQVVPEENVQKWIDIYHGESTGSNNEIGLKEVIKKIANIEDNSRLPQDTKPKKVIGFMKKTVMRITNKARQALKGAQESPWTAEEGLHSLAGAMDDIHFLELNDYIEDLDQVQAMRVESQDARNIAIVRDYEVLKDFMSGREYNKAMYFVWQIFKNNRSGMVSVVNPQSSKMHRQMFTNKGARESGVINLADTFEVAQLKIAIMNGFGQTDDKQNVGDMVAYFDDNVMDAKGVLQGDFDKASRILNKIKPGKKLPKADQVFLVQFVKSDLAGEGIHSMAAMQALHLMSKAIKKNEPIVKVNLGKEIDGITNGVIAAVMQMGLDREISEDILASGGIYLKGGKYKSYTDFIEKGGQDNYLRLAEMMDTHIQKAKDNLTKGSPEFEQYQAVLDLAVQLRENDGSISKAGRQLAKDPLMLIVYASGISAIQDQQKENALEDLAKQFEDKHHAVYNPENTPEETQLALDEVGIMLNNLNLVIGTYSYTDEFGTRNRTFATEEDIKSLTTYDPEAEDSLLTITLNEEEQAAYKEQIGNVYGDATAAGVSSFFGDLLYNRDMMNNALNVMAIGYSEIYRIRQTALKKELGISRLSNEQERELQLTLRNEGLIPGMAHATSEDTETYSDNLEVVKSQYIEDSSKEGVTEYNFNDGFNIDVIDTIEDSKPNPDGSPKDISHNAKDMATRVETRLPDPNLGVMGSGTGNQSFDGDTQILSLIRDPDTLQIHDAMLRGILRSIQGTIGINEDFLNAHSHNMYAAVNDHMQIMLKAIRKSEYAAAKALVEETITGKGFSRDGVKERIHSLDEFLAEFKTTLDRVTTNFDALREPGEIVAVDQFTAMGQSAFFPEGNTEVQPSSVIPRNNTYPSTKNVTKEHAQISDEVLHEEHLAKIKLTKGTTAGTTVVAINNSPTNIVIRKFPRRRNNMWGIEYENGGQYPGTENGYKRRKDAVAHLSKAFANQTETEVSHAQREEKLDNDREVSGSEPGGLRGSVPVFDASLNANTAEWIFSRLKDIGNTTDSIEHAEYLKSLITDILLPVLTKVDGISDIEVKASTTFGRSKGEYAGTRGTTPETIYVAGTEAILNSMIDMSPQEVFAHESMHALLRTAIDSNPRVRKEARKLFFLAKKFVTPEDLLRYEENGDIMIAISEDIERATAKERYDYIFNNGETGLQEFAAFALTNKPFMDRLATIDATEDLINTQGQGIVKGILLMFMNIGIRLRNSRLTKAGNTKIDKAMLQLAKDMNNVQKSNIYLIDKAFQVLKPINSKARELIKDNGGDWYVNYAKTYRQNDKRGRIRKVADTAFTLPYSLTVGQIRENFNNMMYNMQFDRDNFVWSAINEVANISAEMREYMDLHMNAKHTQDSPRERSATEVAKDIKSHYFWKNAPTRSVWRSMTKAFIKTDATSLIGDYSQSEILKLMSDPTYRRAELVKWRAATDQASGHNSEYTKIQAENLGNFMAHGRNGLASGMKNAYNIATLRTTNSELDPAGDLDAAIRAVDILATLYAIDVTSDVHLKRAVDTAEAEMAIGPDNGHTYFMNLLEGNRLEAADRLFGGNKVHMAKGYSAELPNEFKDWKVGTMDDRADFERDNWVQMGELPRDPNNVFNSQRRYIYVSRTGQINRTVSGIASTSDRRAKGILTSDLYFAETNNLGSNPSKDMWSAVQSQLAGNNVNVNDQFAGTATLDFSQNYMSPILANYTDGIVDFAYNMDDHQMENYMGTDNQAQDVLGRMYGQIEDKPAAISGNKKLAELLKKTWDARDKGTDREYFWIGPNSEKKEHRETWEMLPKQSKEDFYDVWGQDGFYVKDAVFRISFGFRKFSFTDLIANTIGLPKYVGLVSKLSGVLWQAIVARRKRNVVLFDPEVVISNILSNQKMAWMEGVPPQYNIEKSLEGAELAIQYMSNVKEVERLQREIKAEKNTNIVKRKSTRIAFLEEELKRSPLAYMMEQGVFQNIMEDIREDGGELGKAVANLNPWFENMSDVVDEAIPSYVKKTYDQLTIAPNTNLNIVITNVVQFSDFVGRYAMWSHLTQEQNMSEKEALDIAMDDFINYDTPTSKGLQYINDMGLFMFSKYLLRVQRVIARQFAQMPASMIAAQVAQNALGIDFPSPTILTPTVLMNHIPSPMENLTGAFNLNLIDQHEYFTGLVDIFE